MSAAGPIPYDVQPGFLCIQRKGAEDHKAWPTGATVRVAYVGQVSPVVRGAMDSALAEWQRIVGTSPVPIDIKMASPDDKTADVRIAEGSGISWCVYGADALDVREQDRPTAWFGIGGWKRGVGAIWTPQEVGRVARHMCGHIYGLAHPLDDAAKWKPDAVKRYLAQDEAGQLLDQPGLSSWTAAAGSIMRFDRPAELVDAPVGGGRSMSTLSDAVDAPTVALLKSLYPTSPDVEVAICKRADMDAARWGKEHSTSMTSNILPGVCRLDLAANAQFRFNCFAQPDLVKPGKSYEFKMLAWGGPPSDLGPDSTARWLSFPPADARIQTGTKASQDIRPGSAVTGESLDQEIKFAAPFARPPKVVVSLTGFDINRDSTVRAKVYATDITPTGFKIHLETWADTSSFNIMASWLAYPADDDTFRSGSLDRPGTGLQLQHSADHTFDSPFVKRPRYLWYGLSLIDTPNTKVGVEINVPSWTRSGLTSVVSATKAENRFSRLCGVYIAIL
ncbi:uncharacterized protein PFL1_03293 [Pseudozyma flocculosa PF-1]|uniref:H-type lectin domain-containing protein n=2 Tax=Pseudozyma flocculosa TaxID=84751 RepID=A0A5C3F7G0_9BASI|nr:uncharacterized protein PFL1_03293 [Pseudozyma flocculosa PF-1]EPQ29003.1 hypothetical protein PFL1_03293 [Pseudozyma flocculosa PF-1]SPO39996.1 uncharacterized protein PSFLO_05478 [Pseudozyma flocculosa]